MGTSRTRNTQISKCGAQYSGHCDTTTIQVFGSDWGIAIPLHRMREFTRIFPEVNWEDSAFLEQLKGTYVRITYDKSSYDIISISHIVKELEYMVDEVNS